MMADLVLDGVQWCAHHGHPFLVLRTPTSDRYLAVAISPEDAQAMAVASPAAADRTRVLGLLQAMLAGLHARLTGVELTIGPGGDLCAALRIEGPRHALTLPAHFADGLILARRGRLPLRMADEVLARVPFSAPPPRAQPASEARTEPKPDAFNPFRTFVESLDLDGLAVDGTVPPAP